MAFGNPIVYNFYVQGCDFASSLCFTVPCLRLGDSKFRLIFHLFRPHQAQLGRAQCGHRTTLVKKLWKGWKM